MTNKSKRKCSGRGKNPNKINVTNKRQNVTNKRQNITNKRQNVTNKRQNVTEKLMFKALPPE